MHVIRGVPLGDPGALVDHRKGVAVNEDLQALINLGEEEIKRLSYEDAYTYLQRVLAALESGELPLESSLKMYEVGSRLAAYCAKTLEKAELQVQRWQEGSSTTSFDGWRSDELTG